MTYFETPNDKAAFEADMTVEAYEARIDALTAEDELMDFLGYPNLDPEDRPVVSEGDVETVSAQDREDLQTVLDWEEFHI